jgi:transposase
MPTVRPRRFSPEFKLKVMERIRCGEVLSAVADDLGVHRQLLYKWRDALRRGQDAMEAANRKIAELERKVGQQALELDFFQQTLRRFKEPRPAPSAPGVNVNARPALVPG